jgi:hypothetical protein
MSLELILQEGSPFGPSALMTHGIFDLDLVQDGAIVESN